MNSSRMRTACSSGHPGGSPPGTRRSRHPPEQSPQGPGTPQEQTPFFSRNPPGTRHPQGQVPPGTKHPLLTQSQTPVKTLPCPNFVAGGKSLILVLHTSPKNHSNVVLCHDWRLEELPKRFTMATHKCVSLF